MRSNSRFFVQLISNVMTKEMKKLTDIQRVRLVLFLFLVCSLATFVGFMSSVRLTSSRHVQRIRQRHRDLEKGNMVDTGTEKSDLADFPKEITDEYRWSVVDSYRLYRELQEQRYAGVFVTAMMLEFFLAFALVSYMAFRMRES